MRSKFCLSIALLSLSTAAVAETTAFVNVNVIPMTSDQVLESRTVIVADGIITTVGVFGDTPVPGDALVVDGTDRYLMPGLAEMHGHVPAGDAASLERILTLYVANGVTTVRGMLGQPSHLTLREDIESGEVLGPRLVTSGPSFNGRSVSSPEQGARMVRDQHAAGYDFLKIHPGLTREEFDAVASTANEIGIPFAGHVPEDVGVPRALEAGIATIDHLDGYMQALLRPNDDSTGGVGGFFGVFIADLADETKIDGIAAATARAGTWNVPTESLFAHVTSPSLAVDDMVNWPEMQYMDPATVARWRSSKEELLRDDDYDPDTARRAILIRQKLLRALHEAGAGLLLGSDSPQIFNVPGFALHRELEFVVDAGISPFEALKSGTVNPARFFGQETEYGRVEEGLVADLILLDANPLEDIGNSARIHGVVLRGRWLPRSELDGMLANFEH
jgi:imidazolonepropionase-like amidohydrolase